MGSFAARAGRLTPSNVRSFYKYDKPGKYLVKLKTNTTLYPVSQVVTILDKVDPVPADMGEEEQAEPQEPIDTLALVQNDIKTPPTGNSQCRCKRPRGSAF